ncbi:LysR family transcriptional regulator [Lachnospiraceae bacterium 54-53]
MDTKYLTYVLTIAETKNMTKAAEELYISQSSLSQYISKLEKELGTPLFERAKGELNLTAAGKLYTEAAGEVLSIKEELYRNIKDVNIKGHITVGITSQFGLSMLTEIIPGLKKIYPLITIEISETNVPSLTQMLLDEEIDCGIMALNQLGSFLPEQVPCIRQEEVLFAIPAGHPYVSHHENNLIRQDELAEHFHKDNFILSKKGSTLRYLADKIFSVNHFHPFTMCETNSVITSRSMTAKGIGVSFIARSCITPHNNIRYCPFSPKLYRYNALICRKNWVKNQPEQAFIQLISDYFQSHPMT